MCFKTHLNVHYRPRAGMTIGLFLVLVGAAMSAPPQGKLNLAQVRALAGEEIGRGVNQIAATELKLYTYRVEALKLPQEIDVMIDGKKGKAKEAWRITISAEHFRVGAMPAVLLIDDQPVAIGMESRDETELSFIVVNPRFIRNGAALAITYEGDLLVDSRDSDLAVDQIVLPQLEGARRFSLPETMAIKGK